MQRFPRKVRASTLDLCSNRRRSFRQREIIERMHLRIHRPTHKICILPGRTLLVELIEIGRRPNADPAAARYYLFSMRECFRERAFGLFAKYSPVTRVQREKLDPQRVYGGVFARMPLETKRDI